MKIKLLQHTPQPEIFIGQMAGICYGKENSDDATCIKRAAHCVEKGHLSTLRFAHATFHIIGISRVCSHQLVRSKFLDFLQRSQRYCNESQAELIVPDSIGKSEEVSREYQVAIDYAFYTYEQLLKQGVKKEDARMILPACTTTEMVVTGSFQAWRDFIRLRDTKEAQQEIREVAQEIKRQLGEIAPNIFGDVK